MIKIFLHVSFGVLDRFYSRDDRKLFQGAVQGNRVALLLWLTMLIFLVRYLYSKRVVIQLVTLDSNTLVPILALTNANNTDLHVFNEGGNSTEELVVKA